MSERNKSVLNFVAGILLLLALASFFYFAFARLKYQWEWDRFWDYREQIAKGWGFTLLISVASLVISVLLGLFLMAGQRSGIWMLRAFCRGYVELIRGTPLLVQIFIAYYIVADAVQLESKTAVGILALSSFSAAYLAEIFRGGVDSIARTQVEAARAVGFDNRQVYQYVIIPQALRRVLPGVAGQLVNLVKDSSLLSVIGIEEYTKATYDFFSATYKSWEGFVSMACGYLIFTIPIMFFTRWLEERFRYEN